MTFPYARSCVQAEIQAQKAALQKHAVVLKTSQRELQTATLEAGTSCRSLYEDNL